MSVPQATPDELTARRESDIARGALGLFLEKGFHASSVREIAAAAGLSMGGMYQYISSKDDVLSLVYRHLVADLEEAVAFDGDGDGPGLEEAIAGMLATAAEHGGEIQLLYRETASLDPAHREQIAVAERARAERAAGWIRERIDAGEIVDEDPELIAHLLAFLAAFLPLRRWVLRHRSDLDTDAITAAVARILVQGLGPGQPATT